MPQIVDTKVGNYGLSITPSLCGCKCTIILKIYETKGSNFYFPLLKPFTHFLIEHPFQQFRTMASGSSLPGGLQLDFAFLWIWSTFAAGKVVFHYEKIYHFGRYGRCRACSLQQREA